MDIEKGRGREGVKRQWRSVGSHLPSYNKYSVLSNRVMNKGLASDSTEGVRDLRRTLQPLKEVWLQVGLERVDNHKGVSVKALLDSGATGMFADKRFVEKNGFKLEKLERPVRIRNVDGTGNSGGLVMHEIEVNVYYQGHVERMKLDVCDLGRTEVILGMPWLAAHNPKINWETGEVRMTRCLPLCGRNKEKKQKLEKRKKGGAEKEAAIRWMADEKEDWGREEELELDHQKIEGMVPKRFHRWLKVFGKVESERMLVRKAWDHYHKWSLTMFVIKELECFNKVSL